MALAILAVLALGAFWFSSPHSREVSDGEYGCHTNNIGIRSFWGATVRNGQLVAMEPDMGSVQAETFSMATHLQSGEFDVVVNGHITATCESED